MVNSGLLARSTGDVIMSLVPDGKQGSLARSTGDVIMSLVPDGKQGSPR